MPTDPLPGNSPNDPNFFCTFRQTRYAEKEGSPEQNLFFDRGQLVRHIWVHHSEIYQAMLDFCGGVAVLNTGLARTLERVIPHQWPKLPWMIVQGMPQCTPYVMRPYNSDRDDPGTVLSDFQARDPADDTPMYEVAEMSFQYVMPTFLVKEDSEITNLPGVEPAFVGIPDEGQALANGWEFSRYVTRQIKRHGRMLTIPRGLLKGSDGKLILEAIAINEGTADYQYTWHQVPHEALPENNWTLGTNTVNDEVFDGHPPGTLLFSGEPEIKLNPNPITGQILYDVVYTLHSLKIFNGTTGDIVGHNWIRKVVGGKITPVLFSSTGSPTPSQDEVIYRDFDFRKLFRPDPP